MNMGGGMLRSVARAVAPTTSHGFSSAPTGGQVQARPSSLRTTRCTTCSDQKALSQQTTTSSGNHGDLDDWEFADDYSGEGARHAGLVFSSPAPPSSSSSHVSGWEYSDDVEALQNPLWRVWGIAPSVDEASAAAEELQSAFSASNSIGDEEDDRSMSSESTTAEFKGCLVGASKDRDTDKGLDAGGEWVEPELYASHEIQPARSPVHEAFHLLQNDPNVKSTVISLVSDVNVWTAMMKNEKVQELKKIFQNSQEPNKDQMKEKQEQEPPLPTNKKHGCVDGVSSLLRAIAGLSMNVAWQVQDDLCKIIMGIASLMVLPFQGKLGEEAAGFEKTMRSSMILAVLVMVVVLMKRMPS